MRIGLFTDTYFPATNGAVYMVETIRQQLSLHGHEVFVVAPKKGLRGPRREGHMIWVPSIGSMFYDDQLTTVFFPPSELRTIDSLDLDIIMFFTPGQIGLLGAYSAIKLNLPLVSQYCTDVSEYIADYPNVLPGVIALGISAPFALQLSLSELAQAGKRFIRTKHRQVTARQNLVIKLMTELHNHCDAVVAVSDKMADRLHEWHTTSQVAVIPAGIDPLSVSTSETAAFRRRHGITDRDIVIMYIGRMAEEKNLDLLIDAFELLAPSVPQAKLVFVGDYAYRRNLEQHAATTDSADRIVFTGKYPRTKLGSIYAAGDVFAFPSVTDTQALVVNEAAHAGLPFVWIDDRLNAVLVNDVTGFQAENSPESFAYKLRELCQDATMRRAFGEHSRSLAGKNTEAKQTQKLLKLFESLIQSRSNP